MTLGRLLYDTGYDKEESEFLVSGFTQGFDLCYRGPTDRRDREANLPFTVGNKFVLWQKVMKEVGLCRFAGPFDSTPYSQYIQSPIVLVPKAGNDTRMICHLSYNFRNGNKSVNFWTPSELCSVHYNDLDHAVKNSLQILQQVDEPHRKLFYAKSDLASAFRSVPLLSSSWKWTVFMAKHPVNDRVFFFVNKNLPFGAGISCSHFQRISTALTHLVESLAGKKGVVTNYLG